MDDGCDAATYAGRLLALSPISPRELSVEPFDLTSNNKLREQKTKMEEEDEEEATGTLGGRSAKY